MMMRRFPQGLIATGCTLVTAARSNVKGIRDSVFFSQRLLSAFGVRRTCLFAAQLSAFDPSGHCQTSAWPPTIGAAAKHTAGVNEAHGQAGDLHERSGRQRAASRRLFMDGSDFSTHLGLPTSSLQVLRR